MWNVIFVFVCLEPNQEIFKHSGACAFVSVFVCIEHDKLAHPFIIISPIRSPPHPFISSRGCFDQHSLCYSFSVQLYTTVDSSQPFTNCFALLVLCSLLGLSYSYDLFSPSNFIVHRSRSPRPPSILHLTYVAWLVSSRIIVWALDEYKKR